MDPGNTINASLNQINELVGKRSEFIAFVKKWVEDSMIEYSLLDYILEGPDRITFSPSFLLSQELPYTPDENREESLKKIREIAMPMVLSFFGGGEKNTEFIESVNFFGLMSYNETNVRRTTMDFLKELFEKCEFTKDVVLRQHFQILSIVVMVFREIYEARGKKELELFHKSFNIGPEEEEEEEEVEVGGGEGIGGIEGGVPVTIGGGQPVRKKKGTKKKGAVDDVGIRNLFDQNVGGGGPEDLNLGPIPSDARNTRREGGVPAPDAEQIDYTKERQRAALFRFNLDCTLLMSKLSDYNKLRDEWILSRDREGDTTFMENLREEIIKEYNKLSEKLKKYLDFPFGVKRSALIYVSLYREFINVFPEYTDEWFEKKYIEKIKA